MSTASAQNSRRGSSLGLRARRLGEEWQYCPLSTWACMHSPENLGKRHAELPTGVR